MIKLSIIIVNYNVKHFLEQCLSSVMKASSNLHGASPKNENVNSEKPAGRNSLDEIEVFVVDNNSVDGSKEMVAKKFPNVKLIVNNENKGFSAANNQALRLASGEYVLLLNPDTVVEEYTFEKVITFMDNHEQAGALGVKMIDGKGNFLPESKRGYPSLDVAFYKMIGLTKLFPHSKVFGKYHLGNLDADSVQEVNVLSGAFMMIRKKVLDAIGLLDETFFMYGEDIDLSYRIEAAGFKNYYFPKTRIIHYKGESTKKGGLNYLSMFYHAMILFANKHMSASKGRGLVMLIKIAIYLRAGFDLISEFIKKIYQPVLDAGLIYVSMLFLKDFWSHSVMGVENNYYPIEYLYINIPLYITVWLLSTFFSGGYDKPVRIYKLLRGLLVGTLIIAAIYGFLEEEYRFSRGMIIFGATIAFFVMLFSRMVFHFLRYKNFKLEGLRSKKAIIVGGVSESRRVLSFLSLADIEINFIGFVTPDGQTDKSGQFLGNISQLNEVAAIYKVDEVIFCSRDISAQQIIEWMSVIGGDVDFKIVPEESISFIGSNSKNTAGDIYAVDINLNITKPAFKRNKRVLDLLVCGFILVSFPLTILIVKNKMGLIRNWINVIFGRKTWVSYAESNSDTSSDPSLTTYLPKIKLGVVSFKDSLKNKNVDENTISRLNLLYARDYTTTDDVRIIWGGFRNLGQQL